MGHQRHAIGVLLLVLLWTTWGAAAPQSTNSAQQPPAEKPMPSPEKKPVFQTPSMRLASARNILIIRTHGSTIPFETIKSTLDGWGRFSLVETKDKADLIIEVASSGDSGVQVSSSSSVSGYSGQEEKSTSSRKDLTPTEVTMAVFDARNQRPLWSATESVKFAMKEKGKENNLVEAAERLAAKFHDRLEPAAAK
jgi:hypothetical protein